MPEAHPNDNTYYETRLPLLSQGDIFRDIPLAYPVPGEIIEDDENLGAGARHFLAGPLETGFAMLTTPTCSMRAQRTPGAYAHPVRTLVPLMPVGRLVEEGLVDAAKLGLVRKYDGLINYMYLPPHPESDLPESLALLYMPVTMHHDMTDGQRVTQLAVEGARQLHRKLVWFCSSWQGLGARSSRCSTESADQTAIRERRGLAAGAGADATRGLVVGSDEMNYGGVLAKAQRGPGPGDALVEFLGVTREIFVDCSLDQTRLRHLGEGGRVADLLSGCLADLDWCLSCHSTYRYSTTIAPNWESDDPARPD